MPRSRKPVAPSCPSCSASWRHSKRSPPKIEPGATGAVQFATGDHLNRATRILGLLSLFAAMPPAMPQEEEAKPLVVIDLRPKEETEGSSLAPLSGKCNEDVFRIPDVASDPLKVEMLKADLEPLLGTSGKTLTALNWSIYYNKQVHKEGGLLRGIGVQGYSVPTKDDKKKAGSKCSQKESAGGWYQAK